MPPKKKRTARAAAPGKAIVYNNASFTKQIDTKDGTITLGPGEEAELPSAVAKDLIRRGEFAEPPKKDEAEVEGETTTTDWG